MSEFVDEAETLQANIEGLKHLSASLEKFNESFASWLYIMNMNALTTDWPQVSAWLLVVYPILERDFFFFRPPRTRRLCWRARGQVRRCCFWCLSEDGGVNSLYIEQNALAAMEAVKLKAQAAAEAEAEAEAAAAASLADRTAMTDFTEGETTYAGNTTTTISSNKSGLPMKKKAGKPKMTAKEKKERSVRCFFDHVFSDIEWVKDRD